MNRNQFNNLVRAGVIEVKEEKKEKKEKGKHSKITLRQLMVRLEEFNIKGIINSLSIQQSDINACKDYTHVSFKIPKGGEVD